MEVARSPRQFTQTLAKALDQTYGKNTGPEVVRTAVTSPEAFVNFRAEDTVDRA